MLEDLISLPKVLNEVLLVVERRILLTILSLLLEEGRETIFLLRILLFPVDEDE